MSKIHKYFDRKYSEWDIVAFLKECEKEPFESKADEYVKSLEAIIKRKRGFEQGKARILLNKYREASMVVLLEIYVNGTVDLLGCPMFKKPRPDRQRAKKWDTDRTHRQLHLHQSTLLDGIVHGNINNGGSGTFILNNRVPAEDDENFRYPYSNVSYSPQHDPETEDSETRDLDIPDHEDVVDDQEVKEATNNKVEMVKENKVNFR
ncbi:19775_t:CDS:2 [Funneliformis geosporum]|uniref:263_t:CDS:1 n=1 Tax=Funneliformis geosporum TaxID=1117311 RepID=A0A9W4WX62_9GLOM|nr:19775_t:CDS:2 [Funneliformis geosporum]CAI2192311.1 263_t:CDS:2 [Funneliformis geosporum]